MVKVKTNFYSLTITINNLTHLKININQLYGYQSWVDRENKCIIQYYCKNGNIKCEYQDMKLWKDILKKLEGVEFN